MAPFGYSIEKEVAWRNGTERFSNVYHYDSNTPSPTNGDLESILDALVTAEKAIHGAKVSFKVGRVWGPTDQGAAASVTRIVKDLSGAGTQVNDDDMPAEITTVAQLYLGRSSTTQRKRFLRKYYHTCSRLNTAGFTSGAAQGNVALPQAYRDKFVTHMNAIKTLNDQIAAAHNICAPNGDHLPLNTTPTVLPHMHIRQFKQ